MNLLILCIQDSIYFEHSMSIYTHLTQQQFHDFCSDFGLQFKKAIPITQGIKNSNWFIETQDDVDGQPSFVFTLFEERKPHEIQKMAVILNHLKQHLPVACPLKNKQNQFLLNFDNKAILISPKLSGQHPHEITLDMCVQMGRALATLHETLKTLSPDYGVELYPWHIVKEREILSLSSDEAQLMNDVWQAYQQISHYHLPKGLCHLDMFADNTLWNFNVQPAQLTGLLDFTEVSVEYFVMDLAITINDFCSQWDSNEHVTFHQDKMLALIDGYESVRQLNIDEKQVLPIVLAQAALTFWLLRLNVLHYNQQFARSGDDIMVKNPNLMRNLVAYHWKNVK